MFHSTLQHLGSKAIRALGIVVPLIIGAVSLPLVGAQAAPGGLQAVTWEQQAPLPTGATLYSVDMISATEGWATGERDPMQAIGGRPSGTILHTTDGGRTWQRQNTGVDEKLNTIRFLDSQHGWAAGSNITLYTTNGGATWQRGADIAGTHYFIEPANLSNIYLADGYNYYHKSTDGGRTWQTRFMPGVIGSVRFFGTQNGVANGPDGTYHTSDAGANWSFVPGHGATDWFNRQVGFFVSQNRVERTTDGGATWQAGALPAEAWVLSARFISATTGWAVGSSNRIYHTTNGGLTWATQFGQDPYPYFLPFYAVDFADALHGVAVGGQSDVNDGLLFYTDDGGQTWHDAQSGTGEYIEKIVALDANHAWASANNNIVLYTTDGGARWNRSRVLGLPRGTTLREVDFATHTTGWVTAGRHGNIAKSTDGGRSWNVQFAGLDQYVHALDAVTEQTVFVVGGGPSFRMTQRSTDGGLTWTEFDPAIPDQVLYDIFFLNPTTGWVVGSEGGIARTTDGGATWRGQADIGQYPLATVHFADSQNGWTGGTLGELFRTTDGGTTWTRRNAGLTGYGHILDVSAVSASEAWIAGGEGDGLPYIKHTTDGGVTWVRETPPSAQFAEFTTIFFHNTGAGWAGG